MPDSRHVIDNPLSGEQITILPSAPGTDEDRLRWELVLAPGGRVPSSHAHPAQEERFTVVAGEMTFRVGHRRLLVRPGEAVTVPPGTVHHFANAGSIPVRVSVETTPALDMEALLETAAALARDQHAAARRLPRLVDLVLFLRDFEREVRAPWLPALVVQVATCPVAWWAEWRSLDQRYRRLRPGGSIDRP